MTTLTTEPLPSLTFTITTTPQQYVVGIFLVGSSAYSLAPERTVSSIVPLLYMSVCLSVYCRDQVEVSLFLPRTYDAPRLRFVRTLTLTVCRVVVM